MTKKLILLSTKSFWRMSSCGHDHCFACDIKLKVNDLVIRNTGKGGKAKYYHDKCFGEY